MKLTSDAIKAIKEHAVRDYPKESCGFIVNGDYVPMWNESEEPERAFSISQHEYLNYADAGLEAVVHSHPDGPLSASKMDMEQCQASALPWGILITDGEICSDLVWMDDNDRPPLIGRNFVWGVTDCYTLIRDYYLEEFGVFLKEFPREDQYWLKEGIGYLEQYEEGGFYRVPLSDAKPGDLFLAKILSPVENHGGVIVTNTTILHHLYGRLSKYDVLGPWYKRMTYILRHPEVNG